MSKIQSGNAAFLINICLFCNVMALLFLKFFPPFIICSLFAKDEIRR